MTSIKIKSGVTGFLNDFFIFNNVEFSGSTSGYTGKAYIFVTSSDQTQQDPLLNVGTTGLKVANGYRTGETFPYDQFIEGIDDYTNGFTNQIINFKYDKYNTNNNDCLKYNDLDLNYDSSSSEYTNNLTPSQTFKMRILRNTKDDKYDFIKGVTFSGIATSLLGTSFFSGLLPDTRYTTSFLTYNEGTTGNTSLIENFQFTTGSTGMIFGANKFDVKQNSYNNRQCFITINSCFYKTKPGKTITYLPDSESKYQLLLDSNVSTVQVQDNNPTIFGFFEGMVHKTQLYTKSGNSFNLFNNGDSYWVTDSHELRSKSLYFYNSSNFEIFCNADDACYSVTVDGPINYNNGDLYINLEDSYIKAPFYYFKFVSNIILIGVYKFNFTSEYINNTGKYDINNITKNEDMNYTFLN
jgi:hypothetical protein